MTHQPHTTTTPTPPAKTIPLAIALGIPALAAVVGLLSAQGEVGRTGGWALYLAYPFLFAFVALFFAVPAAGVWWLMARSIYRGRVGAGQIRDVYRQASWDMSEEAGRAYLAEQGRKDPWIARALEARRAEGGEAANRVIDEAAAYGVVISEFDIKEYVGRMVRSRQPSP